MQGEFLCKMTKHAPSPCLVTYKRGMCAELMGFQMSQRLLREKQNELAEADDSLSLHHSGDSFSHIPIKHFLYRALSHLETWGRPASESFSKEGLRAWRQGEKRLKQTQMISAVI